MIDEPLDRWLLVPDNKEFHKNNPQLYTDQVERLHNGLHKLHQLMASESQSNVEKFSVLTNLWTAEHMKIPLSSEDALLTQDLYRQVFQKGGKDSTRIQETLLHIISNSEDPSFIPFCLELLNLNRPRDSFAKKRRRLALAILARLAICLDNVAAYGTLQTATRHTRADVREPAIYYLGRAYLDTDKPIPKDIQEHLKTIAINDKAFGPRFMARSILQQTDYHLPIEHTEGAYTFKVTYVNDSNVWRTIQMKSQQTLTELHLAIQDALDWDADHLYAFYMNGKKDDIRYTYVDEYEFEEMYGGEDVGCTDEAIIGSLGMSIKHSFQYLFDYGDQHLFNIELVNIQEVADEDEYPRVLDGRGEIMQYPDLDEEDDDENYAEEEADE